MIYISCIALAFGKWAVLTKKKDVIAPKKKIKDFFLKSNKTENNVQLSQNQKEESEKR